MGQIIHVSVPVFSVTMHNLYFYKQCINKS